MLRAGENELIENVPMPQPPVATEIQLPRADATDGHTDKF